MTSRDFAYDPATGFVTQTRVDGATTNSTATARGNVATPTNARSIATSFHTPGGR